MKVTFLGQSCFLINTGGKYILFDPMISGNPTVKIAVDEIKCDYILLTHGHQDHVQDAEAIARNNDASIISNFEIITWYGNMGIKGHPMNHGGQWKFNFGNVKFVNAVHSSVLPDGTYGGNPGGFVVSNEEGCFYHAGDTALTLDMKLLPLTSPKLDFAILPIGDNFTMGYEDAAIAAEFIECDKIIACHYDTFPVIEVDKLKAKEAFAKRQKKLLFLEIGVETEL